MQTLFAFVLTVLGGTLIFVLGQLASKLILEPLDGLIKLLAKIRTAMTFYANVDAQTKQDMQGEARKEFRKLASTLRYRADTVWLYCLWRSPCFFGLPAKEDLQKLSKALIGKSNPLSDHSDADGKRADANEKRDDEICRILKMK